MNGGDTESVTIGESPAARFEGRAVLRWSVGAAALGLLGLFLGAITDPARLLHAYLIAYAYVITVALGALVFLMIVHAMNASWPVLLRRLCEAITSPLPVLAVLFLPLVAGLPALYPWLSPAAIADEAERRAVELKTSYLNLPAFLIRSGLYLAVWIVVGHLLRRWSIRQDSRPEPWIRGRMRALSAGALPAIALSLSFASFDWLMSLTPAWFSTIYPIYTFAGGFLASIALLTVLTAAASRADLVPGVNDSHFYALGRLLLAFVVFWAYTAYFQYFIQWIANRPEEVVYYIDRSKGPAKAATVLLAVVHFLVPFFALLSYGLKRRPRLLSAVALWILAAHYLDVHWLVLPREPLFSWIDLAALLAVGGAAVASSALWLRGRRVVPVNDPRLPDALRYESR